MLSLQIQIQCVQQLNEAREWLPKLVPEPPYNETYYNADIEVTIVEVLRQIASS